MALVATTLSKAVAIGDGSIVVASATGVAVGSYIRVDQEMMQVTKGYVSASTTVPVLRGQEGTPVSAHPVTALVVCGTGSDWSTPGEQTAVQYPIAGKARRIRSYSASGAIALPKGGTDEVVVLNSTAGLTMTLADPTKDMDGTLLIVIANGKAAHTVSNYAGSGVGAAGGSYDIYTFNASGQTGVMLMAMNSIWVALGPVGGTLTNVVATLA